MPREHATRLSGPRGEGVATVEALRGEFLPRGDVDDLSAQATAESRP
jgi:hypothetical protein